MKSPIYIFIGSLIAILLVTFLMFPLNSIADSKTDQRILELERKLQLVTDELKKIKSEGTQTDRIKAIEDKLSILADEISSIKSEAVEDEPIYKSVFGGAPGASKVYSKKKSGLSIGGYGEVAIGQVREDNDNIIDAQRVILYTGYKFTDNIIFNSEIEIEHATTEENKDGQDGSVSVEFALIDFLIKDYFNLRGGILLAPFGIVNEIHEPTTFYGVFRPSVERRIIPTTWREGGIGAFGTIDLQSAGSLSYRAYAMNSFDSRGFRDRDNRNLRVRGNRARFNDIAFVGRVEYDPFPGIKLGGSVFLGNTGQNERVESELGSPFDGQKIDGFFQMYEVDLQFQYRGLDFRTLFAYTFLDDAELINANNGFEGADSVGEEQFGWYLLAAYNLLNEFDISNQYFTYLAPFVRYEIYDTQKAVPSGFDRDPALDRQDFTIGLNYKPIPNVVVKAEFQWLDNDADSSVNQFNFGLGYVF